jgi:hypothetical protein
MKKFRVRRSKERDCYEVTDGILVRGRFASKEWAQKYAHTLRELEKEKKQSGSSSQ